jgi:hypothetical protein
MGCASAGTPSAVVREAEKLALPGVHRPNQPEGYADCNNPVHWDGETVFVFSSAGAPFRSSGPDLYHLSRPSQRASFDNEKGYPGHRWIEATYPDDHGTLYGWYHCEPKDVCPGTPLTAPTIGAAISKDNGLHWRDLGIILTAPEGSSNCKTANRYFAGGNGDFSVIVDRDRTYVYLFISTYHLDPGQQGVSIARMRYEDRDDPVGKIWKWRAGDWTEPGLGGQVTPIFPAMIDWHEPDANAFWGAAVHWNTYLKQYVILLNRAKDKDWHQEGIYVTFNGNLADPGGWTEPVKILDAAELRGLRWYPQVIGTDAAARETDRQVGRVARLFVHAQSYWEIVFLRPGEKSP